MTVTTVTLPKLGEMVESAVIIEWYVGEGDYVERESPIALVETDKVEVDVPAPVSGTVVRLLVEEDAEVPVGSPICELREE